MYGRLKHAVVRVVNSQGRGSGSIVRADGWVLTNAHVVGDDATVRVYLFDGRRFTGRVVARDAGEDLALLRFTEPVSGLTTIPVVPASRVREGDVVFALGHPMGLDWTLTRGIVSRIRDGTDKVAPNVIQFDAAISPGNSGGPLLTVEGEMVGVVSAKIIGRGAERLGFARRGERVLAFLQSHLKTSSTGRRR